MTAETLGRKHDIKMDETNNNTKLAREMWRWRWRCIPKKKEIIWKNSLNRKI